MAFIQFIFYLKYSFGLGDAMYRLKYKIEILPLFDRTVNTDSAPFRGDSDSVSC